MKPAFAIAALVLIGAPAFSADRSKDDLRKSGAVQFGYFNSNTALDLGPWGGGSSRLGNGGISVGARGLLKLPASPFLGIGAEFTSVDYGRHRTTGLLPGRETATRGRAALLMAVLRAEIPYGRIRPFVHAGAGGHLTNIELEARPIAGEQWQDTRTIEPRRLYDNGRGSYAFFLGGGADFLVTPNAFVGFEARHLYFGPVSIPPTYYGAQQNLGSVEGSLSGLAISFRVGVRL